MRISLFLLRQCSDQRVDVPVSNRADGTSPVEVDPLFVKMFLTLLSWQSTMRSAMKHPLQYHNTSHVA
jgi:hypothetical protein